MSGNMLAVFEARVRSFDEVTKIATVVMPGPYGMEPIEAPPFIRQHMDPSTIETLSVGDRVLVIMNENEAPEWILAFTDVVQLPPAPPAWITLPYATGWEHYPGFLVPGYRKVGDLVYLRGVTRIKTPLTATSTVCTLPSGYYPSGPTVLNVRCGEPNTTARIDINAAGLIVLSLLTIAVGNWISLDGTVFSTTA